MALDYGVWRAAPYVAQVETLEDIEPSDGLRSGNVVYEQSTGELYNVV